MGLSRGSNGYQPHMLIQDKITFISTRCCGPLLAGCLSADHCLVNYRVKIVFNHLPEIERGSKICLYCCFSRYPAFDRSTSYQTASHRGLKIFFQCRHDQIIAFGFFIFDYNSVPFHLIKIIELSQDIIQGFPEIIPRRDMDIHHLSEIHIIGPAYCKVFKIGQPFDNPGHQDFPLFGDKLSSYRKVRSARLYIHFQRPYLKSFFILCLSRIIGYYFVRCCWFIHRFLGGLYFGLAALCPLLSRDTSHQQER